jgi:predicted porin
VKKLPQKLALGTSFALLSGAVLAQSAEAPKEELVIYGAANAQFEFISTSGGAVSGDNKPMRQRLSNVSSDIGFKRQFTLGDGYAALFQYQTGINVDNSSGGTGAGMIGSAKDVFVGVSKEGVGTLKLGRLTGAARWNSGTADFSPAGAGPQDNQTVLASVSGKSAASPAFNVRIDNAVGFESASWGGFSVRAYYGANEGKSNEAVAAGASKLDDNIYSLGLRYASGPMDLRFSAEQRNDKGTLNNTTNRTTTDTDYRVGIRYAVTPNTTVAFGWDSMELNDGASTGAVMSNLKREGMVISAKHTMGKHAIYGSFGVADNLKCTMANKSLCDGSSTGAQQVVLAYNYRFNKQMLAEAFVSQVNNQSRAKYDFDSGGISPGTGAALTAIGFGLRVEF